MIRFLSLLCLLLAVLSSTHATPNFKTEKRKLLFSQLESPREIQLEIIDLENATERQKKLVILFQEFIFPILEELRTTQEA